MLLKKWSYSNTLASKNTSPEFIRFLCDRYNYEELSELTLSGGWGVDFEKKAISF
jgi:hypothetical protein